MYVRMCQLAMDQFRETVDDAADTHLSNLLAIELSSMRLYVCTDLQS